MTHRANHDPVQVHSAGELYPFVIVRQDKRGKPGWKVIGAGIESAGRFLSRGRAEQWAKRIKDFHADPEASLPF